VCRAGDNGRRMGATAQLVDLGVFDGLCEEVETAESTWKFNTAQF
jgi:hypothetical protein